MNSQAPISEPVVFTTDSFDPAVRFDVYRDYTRSINDIAVAREKRDAFAASTTNWVLGQVMVGMVRTPQMRLSRTAQQVRQDDLDHWVLRVSRSGTVASAAGGRSYRSVPGEIVLESLALPYEDAWTPGEWVSVAFPRALVPGLGHRPLRDCIGPLRHAPAEVLSGFLLALADRLPHALPEDMPRLIAATQAVIVALVDEAQPQAPPPCLLRARIEQVIRDNIASARLTPERVADLAGISRSGLYRLFEADGGVAAHIRRIRLDGVRADLTDPGQRHEPIGRIAARWGFYSTSAFNRSFRNAFGMTPGDARERVAVAVPPPRQPRPAGARHDLASLVFVT